MHSRYSCHILIAALALAPDTAPAASPAWTSEKSHRILIKTETLGRPPSQCPAAIDLNFHQTLTQQKAQGSFDPHTLEVYALQESETEIRVPHRLEEFFGTTRTTLHFVIPNSKTKKFAVYFDTLESGRGQPDRYPGLIGDGDFFVENRHRREINASHFDQFIDFDGDGDLDLFKGGVEPYVHCYENQGRNHMQYRGRLTSGGKLLTLPHSQDNRSWMTVAFQDIDQDGDPDFFPSFNDGPDMGRIVFYRNVTNEKGGLLTFERVGPLKTKSGQFLAGGEQAGGWFPSITFVNHWGQSTNSTGLNAIVGSNHRCWLYRNAGLDSSGTPQFEDAIALRAGGKDIQLINPRFAVGDLDQDGDHDLFAGTQPGPVLFYENIGSDQNPILKHGQVAAYSGNYLIGDAHSGVAVADFDGDSQLDLVTGRYWERTDLASVGIPRYFGGLVTVRFSEDSGTCQFLRRDLFHGSPFTERFQPCDAIRQNSVRAFDWNGDGRLDLLAGDTDGFIWLFANTGDPGASLKNTSTTFATGQRILAAGKPLNLAKQGGHARLDVTDWNNDNRPDLVVADGLGTITLFLNQGTQKKPRLDQGRQLMANQQPFQAGNRASVLAGDWNHDGRKDLIVAGDKEYAVCLNTGTDHSPVLAPAHPIRFNGGKVSYVRPNLGSLVDWDGDGVKDLIGCHFENSIRFYRNLASDTPGQMPRFANPEGVNILQASSPQMISGADIVDWNGDGDLDLLTGQGHGGSGLRFYERDWLENERHGTHPKVRIFQTESKER